MPDKAYDLARRYTVEEVLAFPEDGNRYELVDGELLVTPSPTLGHQDIASELGTILRIYLDAFGLRRTAFSAPGDISFTPQILVQPDVFVIYPEDQGKEWKDIKRLRLAIEIISPRTEKNDRFRKRLVYQRYGVETYWIVDRYQKCIEVWTPAATEPEIYRDTIAWQPDMSKEPLVIAVQQLWDTPGAPVEGQTR